MRFWGADWCVIKILEFFVLSGIIFVPLSYVQGLSLWYQRTAFHFVLTLINQGTSCACSFSWVSSFPSQILALLNSLLLALVGDTPAKLSFLCFFGKTLPNSQKDRTIYNCLCGMLVIMAEKRYMSHCGNENYLH